MNQPSTVRGGDRIVFEPGPASTPTVSVRSAFAGAGVDVDVPLDVVVLTAIPDHESLEMGRAIASSTMGGTNRHLEDVWSNRATTTS
jgi:hypothetical protein